MDIQDTQDSDIFEFWIILSILNIHVKYLHEKEEASIFRKPLFNLKRIGEWPETGWI